VVIQAEIWVMVLRKWFSASGGSEGRKIWRVVRRRHRGSRGRGNEFAEWGGVKNEQQRTRNRTFRQTAGEGVRIKWETSGIDTERA